MTAFPRYYVAGPMSGRENLNRSAFDRAARLIRERDPNASVIIPHDVPAIQHSGSCPASHVAQTTGDHSVACYLRADLLALLESDVVYVLSGWEASTGARHEVLTAAITGIPIEFETCEQAVAL